MNKNNNEIKLVNIIDVRNIFLKKNLNIKIYDIC